MKKKKIWIIGGLVFIIFISIGMGFLLTKNYRIYNAAIEEMKSAKYDEAIQTFTSINDYKDAKQQIVLCKYKKAMDLLKKKKYDDAIKVLEDIKEYEKTADGISECKYQKAMELMTSHRYLEAADIFAEVGYKDSDTRYKECKYNIGKEYYEDKDYKNALIYLENLDYENSEELVEDINNQPYTLKNFVKRYNAIMQELDKIDKPAVELDEESFDNGSVTLFSGATLSLNNDQHGENYENDVTNFNYYLSDPDKYDLYFSMSEMYAVIGAMDPKCDMEAAGDVFSELMDDAHYTKNGVEYSNYSFSGFVAFIGTRE